MVGLQVNETIVDFIPPSQGYGNADPGKFQTLPLVESIPMLESYTPSAFSQAFSGMPTQTGAVFTDPHYGWKDMIFSDNSTNVVVLYEPQVGQVFHPYGWPVMVTNVSSVGATNGTVTITNELTSQDIGKWKATNWVNSEQFYLSDVNTEAGTYTVDYNEEVAGNTLIFTITVVSIVPSVA
jgi:hypothetical protein